MKSIISRVSRLRSNRSHVKYLRYFSNQADSTQEPKDSINQQQSWIVTVAKSSGWVAGGLATALLLPASTPSAVSILSLAYFSSRAAQPFVNTKLAVQRGQRETEKSSSVLNSAVQFISTETSMFTKNFLSVGLGSNSHAGGNIYALRGAFAKMLTFAGFDAIYSILSPMMMPLGVPYFITVMCSGLISGIFQGTLISIPEYLSTLQSRFPDKKNAELFPLMIQQLKATYGLPVLTVSLRNGIFDMIFNTMRVAVGLPFGPSAVISMTINYPIERYRSLIHQHEIPKTKEDGSHSGSNSEEKKEGGSSTLFQGWFSKAVEFFAIYQLLQILKDQMQPAEEKKVIKIEQLNNEEDAGVEKK